jgi:hypothetical protein
MTKNDRTVIGIARLQGISTHGHQPIAVHPINNASGGHQPTTGQGPVGAPPNQGGGGQGGNKK